jgi:WD40 repeat protein
VYPANHLNDDDDDDDDNNNDKGTNDNDGQPFKVPRHLVLGHYSTIVKLHHISNNKNSSSYLVSCDRDGKIRVSHFPQCHNIQSFCLGHDAFVNATASIEWQGLSSSTSSSSTSLISGGGDGRLILWDILTGVSTQILSIASVVNNDLFVAGHPPSPVVTSIVVVNSTTGIPLLCVALESYRGLLVFQLESPSSCIFRSTIEFQHPITSITSLKQDSAHVCVTLDDAPWVRVISLDAQHVDNNVTISHTFAGDAEASLQRSLPDDAQSVSPQERTRIRGVTALWANLRKFISADTRAATANVSVSDGFSEDGIHRQPKKPRANE